MSNIISKRVPYEGPDEYKIMCVGEAPGAEEGAQGRPFIGRSGELLTRYLNRNGVDREEVKLCNLFNFRPKGNKFALIRDEPIFEAEIQRLEDEINRASPNVIIALGSWPMYYLTGICGVKNKTPIPGSGISLYRGSRLPALERFGQRKVFCSYHPAYIMRVWHENPVFNIDLAHAIEDSNYPDLNYPEYDEYIDPEGDVLHGLTERALKSALVSIDIETFPGGRYSCVGFSWQESGRDTGVCLTYKRPDLVSSYAREIWESPVPKVFQYGTYDISFMRYFYDWQVGGYYDGQGWDTYVASASLLPDYPRGLDFLCSIYTRFPYYKTERKVWRELGDMTILWKYNIKDCIATMHIAQAQMKEIKDLWRPT